MMTAPIQILIVDDEVRFLQTLARRLTIRDFDVVTATSGPEALDKAQGHALDLAIVDLKMPGMDGEELLVRLKRDHPLVEVIILTGHGSWASKSTCHEAGSYSYLHKPCETEELIEVLREAFQRRVLRRLEMEHDQLERLLQQSVGETSLRVLLRLKDIEERMLAEEG